MFWLGAIVSLCYVPGITGAFIATQWPALAIMLPFGLLRSGPFTMFHGFGLLFLAYAAVLAYFSVVPYDAVWGLWLLVIMGLSLWFGSTMTDMRHLYAGLAVGGAASSAVAIAQYFGFHGIPITSSAPAGLYVNSVQQGAALALLVVALASERMWLWALPLLPGLALAHSRGAWLALAVGLLGHYVREWWVFLIVGIVGALYLSSPGSTSDQERMMIWEIAWNGIGWLGWGPGAFYTVTISQAGSTVFPEYAHNDVLQLAFEYGIGALLPLAIFGFALTRTDAREWPVVLAFVAAGCYSMPLWMPLTSFLGLACVGRIFRGHALDGAVRDGSGLGVVSRRDSERKENLSLEPSY